MDRQAMARILANRFEYSEALEGAGFHAEAAEIRRQVLTVMADEDFRVMVHGDGNVRLAIRGGLSWEDVARSTAAGAAGGAIGGAVAGEGIGAIPGAIGGAAYGLLSQPLGAAWYHLAQGRESRSAKQAEDFADAAGRIAGILGKMGMAEAAAGVEAIGRGVQGKMKAVRGKRYDELSKQYGLRGTDASAWEHIRENINPANWGKAIGRTWGLLRSMDAGDGMTRTSVVGDQSLAIEPVSPVAEDVATQATAKALGRGGWGSVGLRGLARGGITGALGYGATDLAWGAASNAIKGQMGVMRELTSDIGKIGTELSRQMGDPSFSQAAQQIQQIVAQAVPQPGPQVRNQAQASPGTTIPTTTPGVMPSVTSPMTSMLSQVQALNIILSRIEGRVGRVEATRRMSV